MVSVVVPLSAHNWSSLNRRRTAHNNREEDAQLLYIMVFASLLSPVVSMLRNIYSGRERRLLPDGRYAQYARRRLI